LGMASCWERGRWYALVAVFSFTVTTIPRLCFLLPSCTAPGRHVSFAKSWSFQEDFSEDPEMADPVAYS
jgi:hypothetical protein